jgi:hypothetical protein
MGLINRLTAFAQDAIPLLPPNADRLQKVDVKRMVVRDLAVLVNVPVA